jgi:hypothetical protein
VIFRNVYFEEKHVFYLYEVETLKLLKISIILANDLGRAPEKGIKVFLEEVIEYHEGNIFFFE